MKQFFFRLALGMALQFYTSVAKGLKLKGTKFWGLTPTFVEVAGGNLGGDQKGDRVNVE